MLGLVHYNPSLGHQVRYARAFEQAGFKITTEVDGKADVHVVLGPWYAMKHLQDHPRVLMIDRAYWGDPDSVSIGWLQPDGSRAFATGTYQRPHPKPLPWKEREQSALLLADYGQDISEAYAEAKLRFHFVRVRKHPADDPSQVPLRTHLALCDVAIGWKSTALVEAALYGVPVVCLNDQGVTRPVAAHSIEADLYRGSRAEWLHNLSYRQFTIDEIADGTAWRHLKTAI